MRKCLARSYHVGKPLLALQFWILKLRLRCKIMIVLSHIKNIDRILLQNVGGLDHNDCCF